MELTNRQIELLRSLESKASIDVANTLLVEEYEQLEARGFVVLKKQSNFMTAEGGLYACVALLTPQGREALALVKG